MHTFLLTYAIIKTVKRDATNTKKRGNKNDKK
nr:MAG TPA: hypothetical protein [Caudoviricetes sp.]